MSELLSLLFQSVVQLILFSLLPLLWWLVTDRKKNYFHWIGFKKPSFTANKLKTFGVVIIVFGLYALAIGLIQAEFLSDANNATLQFQGKGVSAIPLLFIYAVIQTSLSEELFFRGFLCKRFVKQFGFIPGNMMQSILFGLLHGVPFGLQTGKWLIGILLTILPAIAGFTLGWLNEKKANGSIIPSWMIHALINLLTALSSI